MVERPAEDLTAKARIRDAALVEFAARGVRGATVRGIAARAGVSPALVQHHYGTKDGLRAACDERVVAFFREGAASGLEGGSVADGAFFAEAQRAAPPLMRYLARALVDGSPAAARVFDDVVEVSRRHLAGGPGQADEETRAVVFTAMRLGATVLHEHLTRRLGMDAFGPEAGARMARASLDIVRPELLAGDATDRIRAGLDDWDAQRGETR